MHVYISICLCIYVSVYECTEKAQLWRKRARRCATHETTVAVQPGADEVDSF